jgi:hypothetical protein
MPSRESACRYTFVVYDPPAFGLPWLSVCLGPDGNVRAVEAFNTRARAEACTTRCAELFLQEIENGRETRSQSTH